MTATETRLVTARLRDRPQDSWTIDGFLASGGYAALRQALAMDAASIGPEVLAPSGLRGRGGAGFPAATKWSFLPADSFPRYLVVNGDEGEPSTFKDRMLVELDPHQLIEGIAIASYAIGCNQAFVYLRGEFALGYERLTAAIRDAHQHGFLGADIQGSGFDLEIVVHRGAGAYICGEETALLESLEGERGMPRIRPPFPAVEGLYAKPTVVNNVETLATLPHILQMGGAKYAELGVNKSTGTRIFSLSGHVKRPGNYEVELGITFRELIESPELGGGVPSGRKVKFFIPGWCIESVAHRFRRAPRRSPRHGLRPGDLRRHARLRRGHGLRRHHEPCARRVAARQVLRARELRKVHAMPGGRGLDREGPLPDLARPGPGG